MPILAFLLSVSGFGQALVIYRPNGGDANPSPKVKVNDKKLGKLHQGDYFIERVVPGSHQLKVVGSPERSLRAKAGEWYFFQVRVKSGNFMWNSVVEEVEREVAEGELPILKSRLRDANP